MLAAMNMSYQCWQHTSIWFPLHVTGITELQLKVYIKTILSYSLINIHLLKSVEQYRFSIQDLCILL
jgi:hypothetical protein